MPPRAKKPAAWLAAKIEAGRRHAQPAKCDKCGADVLRGPGSSPPDWIATVDTEPVNEFEAIYAYLQGRHSYALIGKVPTIRLEHRDIDYRPVQYPILLDHRCEISNG